MRTRNFDFIENSELKKTVKDFSNKINIYEKSLRDFSSKFLNPTERKLILDCFSEYNLSIYGGSERSERCIIHTESFQIKDYLSVLYINDTKLRLKHRDVLGALISLGLVREDIGDIVFCGSRCEFIILRDKAGQVLYNLSHINKEPVKIRLKDSLKLQESDVSDEDFRDSVASLRLDNIVAVFASTSRSKAQGIIRSGKVKLNYLPNISIAQEVQEGDVISISTLGRFELKEIIGKSKKDRILITYVKKG